MDNSHHTNKWLVHHCKNQLNSNLNKKNVSMTTIEEHVSHFNQCPSVFRLSYWTNPRPLKMFCSSRHCVWQVREYLCTLEGSLWSPVRSKQPIMNCGWQYRQLLVHFETGWIQHTEWCLNLPISRGLNALGFVLMTGIKGVLLLSILSLNLSWGRWVFLAMRKRKLVSFFPGVSFCRLEKDKEVQHSA